MEIQHHTHATGGSFRAVEAGRTAGEMTYSSAGEHKLIIDHTEVDPEFRGLNVGKQLVLAAVEFARANGVKILPLCPYAKSVFQRNPDLHDVLA